MSDFIGDGSTVCQSDFHLYIGGGGVHSIVYKSEIYTILVGVPSHCTIQLIFNGIAVLSIITNTKADFITTVGWIDAAFSCLFFETPVHIPIWHGFINNLLVGDRKLGHLISCLPYPPCQLAPPDSLFCENLGFQQ